LTEIYLCHACSYHEIEDGNGRAGDYTEAVAQLAVYPRGREALLWQQAQAEAAEGGRATGMMDALRQLAAPGAAVHAETRRHAASALAALRQSATSGGPAPHDLDDAGASGPDPLHVMLSYQWDAQELVIRIVQELQNRGFRTWFGERSMAN